ncbi:MAG: sulfatase-like hydrolase/transferase [Opitutales bacterium]|nr:sulfatase-like hydrolase/transferase [Opitutales bacterium]
MPIIPIKAACGLFLAFLLSVSCLTADVLLSTDFAGRAISGATASNITWSFYGFQDPGDLTVTNEAPGALTGLFTTSEADDHFAVEKNIETVGPWSVSIPLVLTVDSVVLESVELDWQHFNGSGAKQGANRIAEWTASVTGSVSGLVASVTQSTASANTGILELNFSSAANLTNAETWTLKLYVDGVTNFGNNTGLDALSLQGVEVFPYSDPDKDGLSYDDELNVYSTDPLKLDTDGDGTPDGMEITEGLDPNDPSEYLVRPNIVFFFVDDLGYGDLGCFWQDQKSGTLKFDTPNIDTMAAAGAKLTHHYVSAPVCAPSRASLIQGRHQGHADVRNNSFDRALVDNHTIADMLQRAGYRTVHVGKSGIAGGEGSADLTGDGSQDLAAHPLDRGFDEFFGYLFHGDGHEHYPRNGTSDKTAHIYHDYQQITNASIDLYTTDAWTAYAKNAIIEEVQDGDNQPFFVYIAYDTPHFKMQRPAVAYPAGGGSAGGIQWTTATDGSGNVRYASTADGTGTIDAYNHPDNNLSWAINAQQHVGMIRRIDNSVGDIQQLLVDLGIDDNTIVIFSSDNGPHNEGNNPRTFESFANFEGTKRDMIEGGIRVPTVVQWKGMIPSATNNENKIHEIDYPSAIWDWMPTFAEIANVPAPAWCDGVSLVPTIAEQGVQRDKGYLYFEYYHDSDTSNWTEFPNHAGTRRGQMQCVRIGDYMGIRRDIASETENFEIYNVVTDTGQATDLAASMTDLQTEMKGVALSSRRSEVSAVRPYDTAAIDDEVRGLEAGLDYFCYEGLWSYVPEFRDLSPVVAGNTPDIDLSARSRDDYIGILYTGYLDVATAGNYTFYLQSDSGANLILHDAHVIDDDFNHTGLEQSGIVQLAAGLHPFRVYYRHGTRPSHALILSWAGPGIAKQAVPATSFYRIPDIRASLSITPGGMIEFDWNSVVGAKYRIRETDDLTVPMREWPILEFGIDPTPPNNSTTLPMPSADKRFYIIEEE